MSARSWLAGFFSPEARDARNKAYTRRLIYVHGGKAAVRELDAREAARSRTSTRARSR